MIFIEGQIAYLNARRKPPNSFVGSMSKRLLDFCKEHKVEQLTVRPIAYPENNENDVTKWIQEHTLSSDQFELLKEYIRYHGNAVLHLGHGGIVYDINGQNLCLTDCLTTNETDDNMRQIIFYPNGEVRYDWKYEGARLI